MYLSKKDNAYFRYHRHMDNYEKSLVDAALKFLSLNPQTIFVDIGASYGFYTLAAANIGKFGLVKKIISFEPDKRPLECLKKSVQNSGLTNLIKIEQKIIGDYDGQATLHFSKNASTSNRCFNVNSSTIEFKGQSTIPCTKLDTYFAEDISKDKFVIKFDVEGNEIKVLKGMFETLQKCKGFCLFFEYYPQAIRECSLDTKDFHTIINSLPLDFAFLRKDQRLISISIEQFKKMLIDIDCQSKNNGEYYAIEAIVGHNMEIPIL